MAFKNVCDVAFKNVCDVAFKNVCNVAFKNESAACKGSHKTPSIMCDRPLIKQGKLCLPQL